jgi:hypothetical protein
MGCPNYFKISIETLNLDSLNYKVDNIINDYKKDVLNSTISMKPNIIRLTGDYYLDVEHKNNFQIDGSIIIKFYLCLIPSKKFSTISTYYHKIDVLVERRKHTMKLLELI